MYPDTPENANFPKILDFHGQEGIQAVSARALYEFLYPADGMAHFTRWADKNVIMSPWALRGDDWVVFSTEGENPLGGRPAVDYHLRLDFAKDLALQAQSDKGKEVRAYFIAIEKRARQVSRPDWALPQTFQEALRALADKADEVEAQAKEIAVLTPRAEAWAEFLDTDGTFLIRDVAKALPSLGLGQNRIYQALRSHHVIMQNGTEPYQRYVDSGSFVRKAGRYWDAKNQVWRPTLTTRVTAKGKDFIFNLLKGEAASA